MDRSWLSNPTAFCNEMTDVVHCDLVKASDTAAT